MKLVSFSVTNYRSITTAHKIQMSNMTVLVGKNNEGKSNILSALSLAMEIMQMYARNPRLLNTSTNRYLKNRYKWERDYPVSLQNSKPNGYSSVDFSFSLSTDELQSIRTITGIWLNSNLPVRVAVNGDDISITIPKRGTAAFGNDENRQRAVEFVCGKIDFNYIPAVRTETDTLRVVEALIEKELSSLETLPEYMAATEQIERLQKSILDRISSQIVGPLQTFMPSVRDFQIHIQQEQRRIALRRNIEVYIDDGTLTPIQLKGDGIKSLTALAILNISEQTDKVSLIAIEEPESHLHPEAARQLYKTISELSENHQVILTTHSPLFVNRMDIRSNVIVDGGKATLVKKVREIREVLGTIVSDNLINAENILLVEGEDDKVALEKLLPRMSVHIKKAMQNGNLIIDYLGGAGNLSYKLSWYRNLQCKYHVLLDNDDAGRHAGLEAEEQGLLTIANVTYTVCNGSPNAELEDCYNKQAYQSVVMEKFGVDLSVSAFRGNNKWSERIENCFRSQGKQWGDRIKNRVKIEVANEISSDPDTTLNSHKRSSIDALVSAIESMLQ